ncbi:MAG: ATP-binding cassette domain-containing protein, partial [Anaerolineae bacterium]
MLSGGDSPAGQLIRGLLWKYRYFVLLAMTANIFAAVFEGSTFAILTIALETHDLREIDLMDWRNCIGVVDQDTFVFNDTVMENIRIGKLDATDEEVQTAARMANAHEFIANLSSGYDTEVGNRGFRLSGGQRQRIAIARAIIRDPQILIFDEATSALDSQSEKLIQESLENVRQERTVIMIAHRLSTIVMADR